MYILLKQRGPITFDEGVERAQLGRSPQDPLIRILAEMVKSALEWEADTQPESGPDSSLNQESTGIDYPPTDPQPAPIP